MQNETPDFLLQYKKTPGEILGERVLPPTYPEGYKTKKGSTLAGKGRPAKYPCAEALQYAIDLYFERFDRTIERDADWHKTYPSTYPTVPGLAYALGFSRKDEFQRQSARGEDFEFVINRALTRIETVKNDLILEGGRGTAGAIMDLKQHHDWKDKIEQTNINTGGDLAALVQALQGKVLRPVLPIRENEEIEEAEYEVEDYAEEVDEEPAQTFPRPEEYAEDAQLEDNIEDLL